jgi:hypothetical protein
MSGKKIEVEVPDGYKLIQDGLEIKFVEQNGNWDSKDKISTHHLHQPEGFQLNKLCQLVYI